MTFDVTPEGWIPGRGDYGAHYASDLIPLVEAMSCRLGCTKSGTQATRDEFGPGGDCEVLAVLSLGDGETRIPELEPHAEGPRCRARVDPATVGMDPLFETLGGAP
jgi:hypothetical protein